MQLFGFNLHGLLCYYNDREVVKKNVRLERGKSINSYDEPIRNPYGEVKKKAGLMPCPSQIDMSGEFYLLEPMAPGDCIDVRSGPVLISLPGLLQGRTER